MLKNTTIAALATAKGNGGIAIVRISGDKSLEVLNKIFVPFKKQDITSHKLMLGSIMNNGEKLDECMAIYMKAPNSYTKEDVVELQLHGSEYIVNASLSLIYSFGVLPAEPGEFTRRAFENGRIDLSQAEAVMQLISAQGAQSAKAALRQLEGGTLSFINEIKNEILSILASIEASIDYPDEIDEELCCLELCKKSKDIANKLISACDERKARYLSEGIEIAICGMPNVGKSSLFNELMLEDMAIVTDIPGTTRDIVRASTTINGLRVHLNDTAGIRESSETVEKIGIEKAKNLMNKADLILMLIDGSAPLTKEAHHLLSQADKAYTLVLQSKADLNKAKLIEDALLFSTKTKEGLKEIKKKIAEFAGNPCENQLSLERHMHLARLAAESLYKASELFEALTPIDLVSIYIHDALGYIGQINGENTSESLLDTIFSTFCVGK